MNSGVFEIQLAPPLPLLVGLDANRRGLFIFFRFRPKAIVRLTTSKAFRLRSDAEFAQDLPQHFPCLADVDSADVSIPSKAVDLWM